MPVFRLIPILLTFTAKLDILMDRVTDQGLLGWEIVVPKWGEGDRLFVTD